VPDRRISVGAGDACSDDLTSLWRALIRRVIGDSSKSTWEWLRHPATYDTGQISEGAAPFVSDAAK
jgi:hypothetical protein